MNTSLRIVFMGTPDCAVSSLKALLNGPDHVVAVVCQPDRGQGRGKKVTPPPVKVLAEQRHIPVLQPESVRTASFVATMRELAPDLFVVAAYGKILPQELLDIPILGAINVHLSLLPKYRGAAPVQWAVINGETETGITIMRMDAGLDTGDILLTTVVPIGKEETAGELFGRLALLGGDLLIDAVARLKESNSLAARPQEHGLASYAPMLKKQMGHLAWDLSARRLHYLIRGLDPWPSAYGFIDGRRVRFFSPEIVLVRAGEAPGVICRADSQGLLVATGEDCLLIREMQPEGKKRMGAGACLRGFHISPGTRIT
jgi:methionyl-tRNA formyltransferase